MKKNIFLRIAALMLVVVFATSGVFMGSGTTAKYVAVAAGGATARVARFQVWINANDLTDGTPNTITCDLYGTLMESSNGTTFDDEEITTDVVSLMTPTKDKIVAPGTAGYFEMVITNDSEVKVNVTFKKTGTSTNADTAKFKYFATDSDSTTVTPGMLVYDSLTDALAGQVDDTSGNGKSIELIPGESKTLYTWWMWRFHIEDTQDDIDTGLGITAKNNNTMIGCDLDIRVVQVD